jgi:ADP-ribose pyrophosphatase YjhB (NUDIX family)
MAHPRREFPEQPLIAIGAVVCRPEEVLLVRRGNPPRRGEWSLPGGLQKVGEGVHEAARREVLEETGVSIEVIGILDVFDLIERDDDDLTVTYHYTIVDVVATWLHGDAVAGGDAAEAMWVALEALPRLGLWEETERAILAGHRRWRETGGR